MSNNTDQIKIASNSFRLTFSYNGETVEYISRKKIDMRPPASDPLIETEEMAGSWYTLADNQGQLIYRRIIQNPLLSLPDIAQADIEETELEEIQIQEETLMNEIETKSEGYFTLVIPDSDLAATFTLYCSLPETGGIFAPAVAVINVDLTNTDDIESDIETLESFSTLESTDINKNTIRFNRDDKECWTLVILAEGYRAQDIGSFNTHAQAFADLLFETEPFKTYKDNINIYSLETISVDEGAKDPTDCSGGTGAKPNTFFNASYCRPTKIRRLLTADYMKAHHTCERFVPKYNESIMIVNATLYGGSGQTRCAVYSTGAGHNVGLHELGHSAFGLGDEYNSYTGAKPSEPKVYSGTPLSLPNVAVTISEAERKWNDSNPLSVKANPDCIHGNSGDTALADGEIAAVEGAYYHDCNIYRPQEVCLMRNINEPFCKICYAKVENDLENYSV
ncbi:MAG: hypothetical protein E2O70_06290 [Candidatus Dadabacteria bacterium]|nr:MAG: hypothetical protein E2O70_06290 [Candidatus Dadabacteria bacterium]